MPAHGNGRGWLDPPDRNHGTLTVMDGIGRRAGLGIAMVAAAVVGILGVMRLWWRPSVSPIAVAQQAYQGGDGERAARAVRAELKTGQAQSADAQALRMYARALARLGRDQAADAIYARLGAAALEPEDD